MWSLLLIFFAHSPTNLNYTAIVLFEQSKCVDSIFTSDNLRVYYSYFGGCKLKKRPLDDQRKSAIRRYVIAFYPDASSDNAILSFHFIKVAKQYFLLISCLITVITTEAYL
jgi:hypothetical protein